MSNFLPITDAPDISPEDRWLLVAGNRVLLVDDMMDGPRALSTEEMRALGDVVGRHLVLGRVDGEDHHWWTAPLPHDFDPGASDREQGIAGLQLSDLRSVMATLDPVTWNIAGRATQICDWFRDNQRCGRCGGPMELSANERSLQCPTDKLTAYPRLSPAVIVLIEHPDGRALLARNVAWPMPMYSTLAGFVEPGESLEDTIHREVLEEVGVEVENLRYFGSQPWPFPNSLMLGFFATWKSGDITPAADEIADAQFFAVDDLPTIPPRGSIARSLVDDWMGRQRS